MICLVKRWKVTFEFESSPFAPVEFYISDDHYANLLRDVAKVQFGLDHPVRRITIVADPPPAPWSTVSTVTVAGPTDTGQA